MNTSTLLPEASTVVATPVPESTSAVIFGEALSHEGSADLRRRVVELFDGGTYAPTCTVYADLLPTRDDSEVTSPGIPAQPTIHLIFDIHRLFVFRPAEGRAMGFRSLLRLLSDAYPIQPAKRIKAHLADQGFQFLYPLDVLDVLPWICADLQAGSAAALDLVSGEITYATVPDHAGLSSAKSGFHAGSAAIKEPREIRPFQDRIVGKSLRERFPENVDQLLAPTSVVQQRFTVRDRLSLPLTTAEVRWDSGRQRESCFGRSRNRDSAETVAVCEALERFQVATRPGSEELILGSFEELRDRALDPQTLFFGRSPLGADPKLPLFDPKAQMYWTPASPAGGGEPLLVPAQEVWFYTSRLPGETSFIRATTNACALGGSVEEAALFALLEAVERDAFLTTWYLRRPARPIDPDSITDPAFHEYRHRWQLAFPSYRFRLFDITTDMGLPAVMAIAVRRPTLNPDEALGPKIFVANACRPNAEAACRVALEDLAGFDPDMTPQRRAEFRSLLERPETVAGPSGHFSLYALDETYDRLSFLDLAGQDTGFDIAEMQDRTLIREADTYNLKAVLDQIDVHSRALGVGVYFKDITHPFCAELDLRCVKAITPGLFPVWFGHGNQRFQNTHRLRRLAQEWFNDDPGVAEDRLDHINLEMHPFS